MGGEEGPGCEIGGGQHCPAGTAPFTALLEAPEAALVSQELSLAGGGGGAGRGPRFQRRDRGHRELPQETCLLITFQVGAWHLFLRRRLPPARAVEGGCVPDRPSPTAWKAAPPASGVVPERGPGPSGTDTRTLLHPPLSPLLRLAVG